MQIEELKQIVYSSHKPEDETNDYEYLKDFYNITADLLNNPIVEQMKNFRHHYNTSCYEHCIEVSYWSYVFCRKHDLDYKSIARASLLHDLFLYDWRHSSKKLGGWHAFIHPKIALENASKICTLNEKEQDIILNHMWPVTFFCFPKYKETYIVTFADKFSAMKSFYNYHKSNILSKKILRYAYIFLYSIYLK